MLPRLRFVVAAAIIAALPWLVFNSGLVTDLPSRSIAEYSRQTSSTSLAVSDLRDARQMYLMSYVRRSRELEKLRELASVPLADWVSAPSGEPDLAPATIFTPTTEIKTTQIAALPAETIAPSDPTPRPAEPENAQQVSTPDVPNEPVITKQADEPVPRKQAALDIDNPLEKNGVAETGSPPPLPRARPARTSIKRPARHYRVRYAVQAPVASVPNVFSGPPASPTLSNNFMQKYGEPQ